MRSVEQLDDDLTLEGLGTLGDLTAPALRRPPAAITAERRPARAGRLELRLRARTQRKWAPLVIVGRGLMSLAPSFLADLLALSLAGLCARATLQLLPHASVMPLFPALLTLLPMCLAYALGGLYSPIGVHPAHELRQLTQITTIGLLAGMIGAAWVGPSWGWFAFAWAYTILLAPVFRSTFRNRFARFSRWAQPALIISSGPAALEVCHVLGRSPSSGLRPVAIADISKRTEPGDLPLLDAEADVRNLVRKKLIRHGVIALPEADHAALAGVVELYSSFIPHLLVLHDASVLPNLSIASRTCGRLSGVELRNTHMLLVPGLVKRAVDFTVAAMVLVCCSPLFLIIATLVKLTSKGPIFFSHQRIGRNGAAFEAYKFRTMRINGDQILRDRLERDAAARDEWERDHKLRDDPRVTRIGRFLRKSSLDELPQAWNVLRGDMSLVGPRPIITSEIWRYGDRFKLYTAVKPGITGLWQVSGRSTTSYAERVRFDEYYVRNWSIWLDAYIIARTAPSLLTSNGAY